MGLFKLKAPFKATGSQPEAIEKLLKHRPGISTLMGLLIQTDRELTSALNGNIDKESLERLREYWWNIANLNDEHFSDIFQDTMARNFQTCDLPPDTPAHICLGFDRVAQLTPQATKMNFEKIMAIFKAFNDEKTDEHRIELTQEFTTLYSTLPQAPESFPPKETVLQNLAGFYGDDKVIEQADALLKIIRQAYYCVREPLSLELYKAFATHDSTIFTAKVQEYQNAAKTLDIDTDFAGTICMQLMMAKNNQTDELPSLLKDERFTLPGDNTSQLQRMYEWLQSWWKPKTETPTEEE